MRKRILSIFLLLNLLFNNYAFVFSGTSIEKSQVTEEIPPINSTTPFIENIDNPIEMNASESIWDLVHFVNLTKSILENNWTLAIFFHADWCYFCQMEKPVIDGLEEIYSETIVFLRVNEAENPDLVEYYNVTGYPTLIIINPFTENLEVISGYKDITEIAARLNQGSANSTLNINTQSIGGLFTHNSCSFTDCLDACTDVKEVNWDDVFTEFVETFAGCVPGTEAVNIPYACSKAMLTEDVNDVIGCLGNLVDLAGAPLSCAYGAGHLLADVLGAQQLGECLGQCAADSGAYGGLCQQGEQRTKCAGDGGLGFVGMDECSDCEWRHVTGSVSSCASGQECVESANGAECREKDDEEDDDDDDDPDKPPRPPNPPDDPHNPPKNPPKKPGYDHPDDNYGVVSIFGSDEGQVYSGYGSDRVAYLDRGYTYFWRYGVGMWGIAATPVTASYLARITPDEYPVLVIPTGALYGLTSPSVRSNLEAYVAAGGVIIVFSQQYGSDYSFLPGGELNGYGFREDESCHSASALIQTYHPSVSFAGDAWEREQIIGEYVTGSTFGKDIGHVGKVLNINIDGFFTEWPENSTLVLQRRKNGMPVEIVYPFGEGYVLATSAYSDMAHYLYLGKDHDDYLVRDSLYWALDTEVEAYPGHKFSTETVEVNKTIYNPIIFSETWENFTKGDLISIQVNVTNKAEADADMVSFELISPSYEYIQIDLPEILLSNESRVLTLEYQTNSSTESGIWMVMYRLYSSGEEIYSMYHGAFTVEGNINMLSYYSIMYEIKDSFNNIRSNGSVNVYLPPSKDWTLSIPVLLNVSGIWSLAYKVVDAYNNTVEVGVDRFAVSDIKENPGGWVSSLSELTYAVSGPGEYFLTDSNITFTVNIWNWGDEDQEVLATWGFPHHIWGEGYPEEIGDTFLTPIPDTPWSYYQHNLYGKWPAWLYETGWTVPLNETLTVPASGYANFTVTVPLLSECFHGVDRLWVFFYDNSIITDVYNMTRDEIEAARIGMSTYGFYMYPRLYGYYTSPIKNSLTLPATEYMLSEETNYTYEIWNTAEQNFTGTFYVHMHDPDDHIFYSEGVDITIPAGGYLTRTFNFSIPNDLPNYQQWLMQGYKSPIKIVAWTESWLGRKLALTQRQIWIKASLPTTIEYNKIVRVREDLGLNVTIQNYSPYVLNTDVNVSIPSLGYEDIRGVSLNQGATVLLDYNISLPTVFSSGGHDFYVTLDSENITIIRTFYTPDSKLSVTPSVGESGVTVTVKNTGGLDVNHTSNILLFDAYYTNILNVSETGVITRGETEVWSYLLPDNLTSGAYLLQVSIHDEPCDRFTNLTRIFEMGNIAADMASNTDKKIYTDYENIQVLTNITNQGDSIEDGKLSLKILGDRPCVPPTNDMVITEDTVLCPGSYTIRDEGYQSVIRIEADNVVLDCNGATLDGINGATYSSEMGWGIVSFYNDNVTIKNCNVKNFRYGISVAGGSGNIVTNNNIETIYTRGIDTSGTTGYFFNNTIIDAYSGFYVTGPSNVIAYNNMTDCTRGVNIYTGNNNFIHSNSIEGGSYGLYLGPLTTYNTTIMQNIVDNAGTGIWIEKGKDSLIYNNTFLTGSKGIEFRDYSTNNLITRNNFTGYNQAIQIGYNSGYNNITWNALEKNIYAIYGQGYFTNIIIAHNNITENENTGIYLVYYCFDALHGCSYDSVENITIASNRIENNGINGISLNNLVKGTQIINNRIFNNTGGSSSSNGIALTGRVYYSLIVNNTITKSYYGIRMIAGSSPYPRPGNNTIYHNNLANNTYSKQAYNDYNAPWNNYWNSNSSGNYWSSYTGEDGNNDGIGDTTYTFSIGGVDNYPVMNISGWDQYPIEITSDFNTPTIPKNPDIPDVSGSSTGAVSSIWSRDLTIDVDGVLNIISDVGTLGVTGKQYLQSTLYTANDQVLSQRLWSFYIVEGDIYLTLETDKEQYKPGEEINITYTAGNWGTEEQNLTISLTLDDTEFHVDDFTLQPDDTHSGSTTLTANATFTLKGTLDGFTITDEVEVITPLLNTSISVPTIVGLAPFNVTIELRNPGNITTDIFVEIHGDPTQISIPPGEIRVIQNQFSITENTTISIDITGDYNSSSLWDIAYGENYTLTLNPHHSYPEGVIDVPFTVVNHGILAADFTLNYALDGNPAGYQVFLPRGKNITDTLRFNLTSGIYSLTYDTPLQNGNVSIIVDAPPHIIVTDPPVDQETNIGEKVNASITLMNIGGRAGQANATLTIPSLIEVWNTTWLEPGEEKTLNLSFDAPDDISEKNYTATVEFMNQTYQINVLIKGISINVTAEMDKTLYSPGENVSLTLTIDNLGDMNLTLFSNVRHGDYDWIRYFNLTVYETEILEFSVPVDFSEKLMYSVYTPQGRSIYINTAYVLMETAPGSGITIYTDKQVYQMQDNVKLTVNVTRSGVFNVSAPGFDLETALDPGSYVYNFNLPKLRTSVYPIDYTFDGNSSWIPIDVFGYEATTIHATVGKAEYIQGENISLTITVLTNKNFDGLVKLWLYNIDGNIIGEESLNYTFTIGENIVQLNTPLDTESSGIHGYAFRIYAYGSIIWLNSGGGYFDVGDTFPPNVEIISPLPISYTETSIPLQYQVDEPTQWIRYSLDGQINVTLVGNTTLTGLSKTSHTLSLYALDDSDNIGVDTVSFTITQSGGTTPVTPPPSPVYTPLNKVALYQPTNVTKNSLTLEWSKSDSSYFKQYTVYQSETQGTLGTLIEIIIDKETTHKTVYGLSSDKNYYYTIRVSDIFNQKADSDQKSTKTLKDTEPPVIDITSQVNITITFYEYTLKWSSDEDLEYIYMSLDGGENTTLPQNYTFTNLSPGTHTLTIYALDLYGNTLKQIFTINMEASSIDSIPPSITHFPLNHALGSEPITIYAVIQDDAEVESATLYFRARGQTSFHSTPMVKCSGCIDAYSAEINTEIVSTNYIEYYIEATDSANRASDPENAPQETYLIEINQPPEQIQLNDPIRVTYNMIELAWTICIDEDFDNYTLFISQDINNIGEAITSITSRSETTHTLSDLSPSKKYFIVLRVYDEAGQFTDSNTLEVTTLSRQILSPIVIVASVIVLVAVIYYLGKTRNIDLNEIIKGLTRAYTRLNQ